MTEYFASSPIDDLIERLFHVEDRYVDINVPTYVVRPKGEGIPEHLMKDNFKQFVEELRSIGHLAKLRLVSGRYVITVLKRPPSVPQLYYRNLLLLAATIGTVYYDGFLRSNNPILTRILMADTSVFFNAFIFTLAILGIFGFHEMGHKLVALINGIEASMPYFIPAPPGLGGTFGAVITQKEPPTNRDALFDLGMSGPVVGFLVTILVATIGLKLSFLVPAEEVSSWMSMFPNVRFESIPFPLIIQAIASIVMPRTEGMVLLIHPVGFAAWVGCIVTFLNLIPSWQLDGGHISRALLGEAKHRIVSVAGIVLMLLSGYFIMAIMLAFAMSRSGGRTHGPLDEISPLSSSRKLLSILYLAMIILTLVSVSPF